MEAVFPARSRGHFRSTRPAAHESVDDGCCRSLLTSAASGQSDGRSRLMILRCDPLAIAIARQQAAASASRAKLPLPLNAIGTDFNWVHMPFAFDNGHSARIAPARVDQPARCRRPDDRADFCDGATECGEKGVRSSPRPITNHSKITRGFDAPSGRSRSP
jgi:hypothetical protein